MPSATIRVTRIECAAAKYPIKATMAIKATVFKAALQIADMDRHYYADHALTLARHPSETDERMMVRLLAFALYADDALVFGKGISSDDEPDLWHKDLTGAIERYGLYAAFIPTIIGVLFGSSAILSTGPVAMTSLLTAASIAPLAALGSEQFFAYAVLLALLSGMIQIGFGLARMGVLLNFLSHPVLMGFINAAALIIGISQIPAFLGISI